MDATLEACDPLNERQFKLAIKRLANSLNFGTDASHFLGAGTDYVQSRMYVPGDPVKSIDWRITARTGRIHLKEYEAPKRCPVYLLVDTSASMCVTSQTLSKYAWAVQIAGGLALAALAKVSPVGFVGCGEREEQLEPTFSRNRIYLALYQLRRFRFTERTLAGQRIRRLAAMIKERSLIFLLSDMHDPEAVGALKVLGQEHDCVVLQVQDPAERGRIGGGFFRGEEAETRKAFIGHSRSRWFGSDGIAGGLRKAGVDHLVLPTDQPILPPLRSFLQQRSILGKGGR
ncbi:MAG: DUF58 domain-containing protein [Verrucomicrobiota bacterium]